MGFYRTITNIGTEVEVPVTPEDDGASFEASDTLTYKDYYNSEGYVVVRDLVPKELCDRANAAFDRECLPSRRYIYRQATANPERHVFTDHGFMLNSILNVQSVDPRQFPAFRQLGVEVITSSGIRQICQTLFGEPGKIVQSMYFHGNPSTWPHQDTYYLDSEVIGTMTAAWIATEDIQPGAGRFFVCPRSHRIDMARNGGDFDIAYSHERYKKLVVDIIQTHQLRFVAPALRMGDVLFWAAKTIHGSLPTTQPQFSRRSFTAHFIPQSQRFLQYQTRIKPMQFDRFNDVGLARPKDQARYLNRVVLGAEARFPRLFRSVKKAAIKAAVG